MKNEEKSEKAFKKLSKIVKELAEPLICPITKELFIEPITLPECGCTVEKSVACHHYEESIKNSKDKKSAQCACPAGCGAHIADPQEIAVSKVIQKQVCIVLNTLPKLFEIGTFFDFQTFLKFLTDKSPSKKLLIDAIFQKNGIEPFMKSSFFVNETLNKPRVYLMLFLLKQLKDTKTADMVQKHLQSYKNEQFLACLQKNSENYLTLLLSSKEGKQLFIRHCSLIDNLGELPLLACNQLLDWVEQDKNFQRFYSPLPQKLSPTSYKLLSSLFKAILNAENAANRLMKLLNAETNFTIFFVAALKMNKKKPPYDPLDILKQLENAHDFDNQLMICLGKRCFRENTAIVFQLLAVDFPETLQWIIEKLSSNKEAPKKIMAFLQNINNPTNCCGLYNVAQGNPQFMPNILEFVSSIENAADICAELLLINIVTSRLTENAYECLAKQPSILGKVLGYIAKGDNWQKNLLDFLRDTPRLSYEIKIKAFYQFFSEQTDIEFKKKLLTFCEEKNYRCYFWSPVTENSLEIFFSMPDRSLWKEMRTHMTNILEEQNKNII